MVCGTCYAREGGDNEYAVISTALPQAGNRRSHKFFKRVRIAHGLRFVLMERNGGALLPAVELEQPVHSPISDVSQESAAAEKPLRVSFDFLCSAKVAVIGSALLMLLIGWIDYITDFNVTVFYFVPVVLATWRAGRKAGWFIAALCGATVLIADLMVPRADRVIAFSYGNA